MCQKVKFVLLFSGILLFLFPFQSAFAQGEDPAIASEAAVLIDAKSGQILYGKNENERLNPASITKIATAIYAIEHSDLNENVVVSEEATKVDGTTVYLEAGEVVPMRKLIIGMMINSGNDAAVAIAEHIDGSVEQFAKHINKYLQNTIGTSDTHFENPNGLFGENHYTTASDMAKITQYALQNEEFRTIFSTKEYDWDGQAWDTKLITHHRLLKGEFPFDANITGGKNGFINESGYTLVTSAQKNNLELIAVTMKTSDKNAPYTDTMQLLDYGFANFQTDSIPKDTTFSVGNREFTVDQDLYYTKNINETYTNQVSRDGKLAIVNNFNETVASFQLTPVNIPAAKNEAKTTSSASILHEIGKNFLPIILTTAILIGGSYALSSRRFINIFKNE